ncbi:MAG: tRNA uridine-5-carboxymethylaminomethyl(34) synthesis GTPase MnmE [Deltaproteobacteria bacterium RIFOXYD12_FULL_55_16]|nr:MAG: tRNA uridine-5-carboxymethylaminomethyl(34) synthesis GTPase MnmE [Deltaproteobacteria bacterium RIFOXYD12_FULL_55_16]
MRDFSEFHEATIAAIATPPGVGGIGIIRVSGPQSYAILQQFFRAKNPPSRFVSHKLYFGAIIHPETRQVIDEVLAVYMRAPQTYTREEVVEIHGHGSYLLLQEILALIVTFPGTRLAEPGEFTKRAFLNGRIDLTQAEAVAELLGAKTKEGASLAVNQLRGGLHEEIWGIRDALLAVRAVMEVAIDFPDEELEILDAQALTARLTREAQEPLLRLLARAEGGKIIREGVSVVILGRPNVGKSSLLNCLLREERAIVTELPGTTRDTIEECLDIKGVPVRIIDTAGIRETVEAVEEIGIRRARQKLEEADLVLLVMDGAEGLQAEDRALFAVAECKKVVVVVNKIDRAPDLNLGLYQEAFPGVPVVAISATSGAGIHHLEEAVYEAATGGQGLQEPGLAAPNVRHAAALQRTLAAVQQVGAGLAADLAPDLLAIDLQAALSFLGEIIGETTTDDVLDIIFADFCLGK